MQSHPMPVGAVLLELESRTGGAQRTDVEECRARRYSIEKEVVRAGSREGAVVREAEVLVLDGLEDERDTRRENSIRQPTVLVDARRSRQLEHRRERRNGMDVTADCSVMIVVILVSAVDRPFGPRHRVDVVEAAEQPLPVTEIQSLLNLPDELLRLVDDARLIRDVGAVRGGSHRLEQVGSAGVAGVHEHLREESACSGRGAERSDIPSPSPAPGPSPVGSTALPAWLRP